MIFIDRSIPKRVATALKVVRQDVVWLDDVFPSSTPDVAWLAHCGREGWMVVSRDKKIRTRSAERAAIQSNGVGAFILTADGPLGPWEQLHLIVKHLPAMLDEFASRPKPFIGRINATGLHIP